MPELPEYFEQFIKAQFDELHKKIDGVMNSHEKELAEIRISVASNTEQIKWLSSKVWMAIGGFTIITLIGGALFISFKRINEINTQLAVKDAFQELVQDYDITIE